MTNIFVTEFGKFNETFKKNSIVHLPLAHHPYYPLQFPHFVYLSYYINAHQLTPTLPISHIVFKMHHLKCSAISFMPISANELEDGISFSKATKSAKKFDRYFRSAQTKIGVGMARKLHRGSASLWLHLLLYLL